VIIRTSFCPAVPSPSADFAMIHGIRIVVRHDSFVGKFDQCLKRRLYETHISGVILESVGLVRRDLVGGDDLEGVGPMALRLRRSQFMVDYFKAQQTEEKEIHRLMDELVPQPEVPRT